MTRRPFVKIHTRFVRSLPLSLLCVRAIRAKNVAHQLTVTLLLRERLPRERSIEEAVALAFAKRLGPPRQGRERRQAEREG